MMRPAARNRRQVMVHGDGRDTATYFFSSFGFFLSDDGGNGNRPRPISRIES